MIFILSDGGSEGSYNDYKKKIVKFEEKMCFFLGEVSGERDFPSWGEFWGRKE
jgi:hypothetical protein